MTKHDIQEAVRANKDDVALSITQGYDTHRGWLEISVTLDDERHKVSFYEVFETLNGVWRVIGEGVDFRKPTKLLRWVIDRTLAKSAADRLGHVP